MRARNFVWAVVLASVFGGDAGRATASSADNPWEADDRLGRWLGPSSVPGWRVEFGLITREAVPEEWESGLRLGFEPSKGPGAIVAWRRFWNSNGVSADDAEARVVFRAPRTRLAVGGGVLRHGSRHAARGVVQGHIRVIDFLLAAAQFTFHSGDQVWETTLALRAVSGPWLAGFEQGPLARVHRISLGLRLSTRFVWTASYTGSTPTVGITWRGLSGEFRGEVAQHALLGSTASICWVVGGLAP